MLEKEKFPQDYFPEVRQGPAGHTRTSAFTFRWTLGREIFILHSGDPRLPSCSSTLSFWEVLKPTWVHLGGLR